MRNLDLIAAVPVFAGLAAKHLQDLAAIARSRNHDRGTEIFAEGEEAQGFYVLITGRVKIFKLAPDGKEQILHLFGPGEVFGEVPVFMGKRFPAYAEALEDTETLFVPRSEFIELIRRSPDLALGLLALLSERLRVFTRKIEELSLREVPGRVAAHLLYLSDQEGGTDALNLGITKSQLAALLGTIPETLSRILTRLTKSGLIAMDGRMIRILDRPALEDLATGLGGLT